MTHARRQLLAASAALVAWPALRAQSSAPIRLWVGTPPGGSTDTIARELAPELGRLLGRTVIVENKSGAGGNIAAEAVASSPEEFARFVKADIARWAPLVRRSGATPES